MSAEKNIKETAAGNRIAFEKLYTENKGYVFAVALSVLRHRQEAEDAVADTFIKVWQSAATYRGGSGKAWLAAIARNLSLNMLSRRRRETLTDFSENESLYGTYSIEEQFADNLTLKAALLVLDGKERETVLLYQSGLKHREIAAVTGEKLGTVTWRYQTALKKLKDYIQKGGGTQT